MNNNLVEKIFAKDISVWTRKLVKMNKSSYLNIPAPVIRAFSVKSGKKGTTVYLKEILDQRTGKLLFAIDLGD
jgi:hypothetical protein